ncbi:MAG: hypothetical protein JXQ73_12640, partial [Phycisphaerae bacterium]|nr:hypothetical protein [Phycisphaerae bacterium]
VVSAGPYLRVGRNVLVLLHHNWGDLITFQRTGNKHAGLYVDSSFVRTDASWRCIKAPQFVEHDKQVVGVIGDRRIRYSQIVDGRKVLSGDPNAVDFDDGAWRQAVMVENGPWPARPEPVETPGQREYAVGPMTVLNAGGLEPGQPLSDEPLSMAAGIRLAKCRPDAGAVARAEGLLKGKPVVIEGGAGESRYITFDFARPVHGYPFLRLEDATEGALVDFGYCEIARALYTGEMHAREDGGINPEGVVGPGYADRYIARSGEQRVEMPDERTARWLALHIHFRSAGKVVIKDVGIVKSQYPIEPVGSFSCGDERVDQIVKLCLIHAEVTMSDAYVDTPGREDGQWIEDDRPRALIAARWFGDDRLRKLLIRTHAEGQAPDGNLHPFSPSNYPGKPGFTASYDWSVQWVAAIYDDYMWTGKTDTIRRFWPNVCKYWDHVLSLVDGEGLWRTGKVLADIRVGVRPGGRQSSGLVTPWIIERLEWSARMAKAIGDGKKAEAWSGLAEKMAQAFKKYHVVAAKGSVPAHVGDRYAPDKPGESRGYSQAGQTIAIWTGLLTREQAVADLEYAFPAPDGSPPAGVTRWNNPSYGYRVLRALSDTGLADRAVAHLIERYAPYLPGNPRNPVPARLQGPYGGPLPEYWVSREDLGLKAGQKNSAQPADETGSHGWNAVPLLWLHDSLLGVRIVEPGGAKIRVAPEDGGLPYVAGHTLTPKGCVWVYWDPQQWRLEVTIPRGATAEVVMPRACAGKRVEVVESRGDVRRNEAGTFEIGSSGRYVFQVR